MRDLRYLIDLSIGHLGLIISFVDLRINVIDIRKTVFVVSFALTAVVACIFIDHKLNDVALRRVLI